MADIVTVGMDLDASRLVSGGKQAEDALSRVGGASEKTESALGNVQKAALALGVTFSAFKAIQMGREMLTLGARYETLGIVVDRMGQNVNKSATEMRALEVQLQKTGISMIETRANIATMIQAEVDLSRATDLARVAQNAAVVANMNSSEAFSQMIYGIQTGQPRILRTMGIMVNFEKAYEKAAKTLGVATEALNEQQRATARTNEVMERSVRIAGVYEAAMGTAGKQIQSATRYVEDMKVKVSEAFQPAYTTLVFQYADALKFLGENAQTISTALTGLFMVMTGKGVAAGTAMLVKYNMALLHGQALRENAARAAVTAAAQEVTAMQTVVAARQRDLFLAQTQAAALALWVRTSRILGASEAELAVATGRANVAQALYAQTARAAATAQTQLATATRATAAAQVTLTRTTGTLTGVLTAARGAAAGLMAAFGGWVGLAVIGAIAAKMALDRYLDSMLKAAELTEEEQAQWEKTQQIWAEREAARQRDAEAAEAQAAAARLAQKELGLELEKQRALVAAFGATEHAMALLNLRYEQREALAKLAETYSGVELRALSSVTNAIFAQRRALLELEEQKRQMDKALIPVQVGVDQTGEVVGSLISLRKELEAREAILKATREGRAAVRELEIRTAGAAAAAQALAGEMPEAAAEARRLAEEIVRAEHALEDLTVKADALAPIFEQAARNIQDALATGLYEAQTDILTSFENMGSTLVDMFRRVAAEIAAVMLAEKLGLTKLLADMKKAQEQGTKFEMSKKWQYGGAALAGIGIGTATGSGAQGALGGAAAGFAIGGPAGALIGGVTGLVSGLWEQAKRAKEAAKLMREVQIAFGNSMDDLVAMLRVEVLGLGDATSEQIRQFVNRLTKEFSAAFPKGPQFGGDFLPGTSAADMLKAMEYFATRLPAGSAALAEWTKVMEAFRLQMEAAAKAEEKRIATLRRDFDMDLEQREANLLGEREALTARITLNYEKEMRAAQALWEAGDITIDQLNRLQEVLIGEMLKALKDFEDAAREAAEALAESRRVMVEDLTVRGFAVTGQSDAAARAALAFAQRRERIGMEELPQATQDLLLAVQDYERRVLELNLSTDAQIRAIEEATAAQVEAIDRQIEALEREIAARDFARSVIARGLRVTGRGDEAAALEMGWRHQAERSEFRSNPIMLGFLDVVQGLERDALLRGQAAATQTAAIQAGAAAAQASYDAQIRLAQDQLRVAEDQLRTQNQLVNETRRVVEALDKFAKSLVLSDLSTLSPIQQLAEARRQFENMAAAAMGGDAGAAAGLPDAARAFLTASRGVHASNVGYATDFRRVQEIVAAVQAQFAGRLTEEEAALAQLESQTMMLREQIDALGLAREQAALNAQAQIDAVQAASSQAEADAKAAYDAAWEIAKEEVERLELAKQEELERLQKWRDDTLAAAQQQIDALNAFRDKQIAVWAEEFNARGLFQTDLHTAVSHLAAIKTGVEGLREEIVTVSTETRGSIRVLQAGFQGVIERLSAVEGAVHGVGTTVKREMAEAK